MTDINQVLAERGSNYGDWGRECRMNEIIIETLSTGEGWSQMDPTQREAMRRLVMKTVRIANGNPDHLDSWRDLEGYARLGQWKFTPKPEHKEVVFNPAPKAPYR